MDINSVGKLSHNFSGVQEQMKQINSLTSGLDWSPMLKIHKEVQSLGLVANGIMEQLKPSLLELQRNISSTGLIEMVSQMNKNIQEMIQLSGISESVVSLNRLSPIASTIQLSAVAEAAKMLPALNQMQSQLNFSRLSQSLESITNFTVPLQQLSNQINSMDVSQYNLSSLISDTSNIFETLRGNSLDLSRINISALTATLDEMKTLEIDVTNDGTVNYQNELFTREDIQKIVNHVLHDSGLIDQQESMEDKINTLIMEVRQLKQPLYKQILVALLCNLIFFLFTPLLQTMQESFNSMLLENKTKIIKEIKLEYQNTIVNKVELGQYRLVTTDRMNVKITNKKNSQSIGQVTFGTAVKVLYKSKNWSLIEYEDEYGETVTGWVYTRYIDKLSD